MTISAMVPRIAVTPAAIKPIPVQPVDAEHRAERRAEQRAEERGGSAGGGAGSPGAALVLLLLWARRFLPGRTPAERT